MHGRSRHYKRTDADGGINLRVLLWDVFCRKTSIEKGISAEIAFYCLSALWSAPLIPLPRVIYQFMH